MRLKIIIFLLLLVVTGFSAKPLWHWLQSIRSNEMTRKGMDAVEEKKWELAYQQADLGLQLDPQNEMGWRIMARVYTEARMDRALFYWQDLENRNKLTLEDRSYYLQIVLMLKRFDLAGKQWKFLQQTSSPLSEREVTLGLEYYRLTQKNSEAITLLRGMSRENHSKYLFLLGEYLIADPSPTANKEGEEILRKLANRAERIGIQAAGLLLGLKDLSESDFTSLRRQIQNHPFYSLGFELIILENEIRRQPRQASVRVEEAFLDWNKEIKNEKDRILLAQWLNRQKRYDLTLKLVSHSDFKRSASLLLLELDALAAQKNWKYLLETLNLQPSPLDPYLIELFRARSLMELKRVRESEAAWEKTFHLVKYQPNPLQFVAAYAVQIGVFAQAKRLYLQMSRFPNYRLESQRPLRYWAVKVGVVSEISLRLEKILEITPESLAAKNDLVYIHLLENRDLTRCLEIAQSLVKSDPTSLAYRSTLALAYLKRGEAQRAINVYQGISIDWKEASPLARWIFYITLKANNQEEFANRFKEFIQGISLRKQEKELMQLVPSTLKK